MRRQSGRYSDDRRGRNAHVAVRNGAAIIGAAFRPDSDVDVLVEFEPGARVGLIGLAGIENELSDLLGRRAEMHTVKGLNPHFRDEVLSVAEVQYEQA